jgi:hypothetical protein
MNLIALSMFISLIVLLANSFDPRVPHTEYTSNIVKVLAGIVLGFVIILLYGVGFPGLRYIFFLIGIGGIFHLILTSRTTEPVSVS